MSWEQWFQDVGKSVIDKAASAKYTQPYEIDKLRLQALGQLGYYTEGQAGTQVAPGTNMGPILLIGGALVLVMVMMKD